SDGGTLVSGSDDNTVRLWDTATGKEIRTISGHQDSVMSVSLSSDGRTLVSGSDDNTVRLWDTATGKCFKTITLLWIPTDVKFFENNPKWFVVAGANGTVALFDLEAV
ncbi:MAG: WD40 repeat domain-containing protein, partial [Desulfobacterales bacterium]|nr:WD40 repeat domain-containing protein [Desulfobacterales bacterium]